MNLKEMIDDALVEMAYWGLKEYYITYYGTILNDRGWWVLVVKLDNDYSVSLYKVKKVDACMKDEACFHSITGTFRLVSITHHDVPLKWFIGCIDRACDVNQLNNF